MENNGKSCEFESHFLQSLEISFSQNRFKVSRNCRETHQLGAFLGNDVFCVMVKVSKIVMGQKGLVFRIVWECTEIA